jgi:hypothetical protein
MKKLKKKKKKKKTLHRVKSFAVRSSCISSECFLGPRALFLWATGEKSHLSSKSLVTAHLLLRCLDPIMSSRMVDPLVCMYYHQASAQL